MGLYGILGSSQNAPNHIAFITMFLSVAVAVGCLFAAAKGAPSDAAFLHGFAEKAFAFAGTCLGFIFGRSTSKS